MSIFNAETIDLSYRFRMFRKSAAIMALGLSLSLGSVAGSSMPAYAAKKTTAKKPTAKKKTVVKKSTPKKKTASEVTAHETYYNGVARKGATLTELGTTTSIVLKKNASVKIVERGSDTYTVQYKNKKYTVKKSKVNRGGMLINSRAYSKKSTENYVNQKKFSSPTKYLVWISLGSQHVYVFKGKQGKWKQVRSFICSTGRPGNETSYGKTSIKGKQPVWYWYGRPCAYHASRISSGAIHSWSSGGLGYPRSHGCVRCNSSDALYVYRTVPVHSTVYVI